MLLELKLCDDKAPTINIKVKEEKIKYQTLVDTLEVEGGFTILPPHTSSPHTTSSFLRKKQKKHHPNMRQHRLSHNQAPSIKVCDYDHG